MILAEGRCSLHTVHRCLRFLLRGICPNFEQFLNHKLSKKMFLFVSILLLFLCFSKKCIGTEEGLSKHLVQRENVEISILWSFAEVYSPPLWDWGTDEATLWKCHPPVIWENQGKKHQRQKCEFSDIQLCNSFLFLNIQIFEKNWYYCVCVCLIKVGQSTQYDIMCVVLSLFFKYAIIQNW